MTYEEALDNVTKALAPQSLSTLQIDVFQRAWNKQSYEKIARELNHEYSYIKDVGAELWKLLSQKLGIHVTKLNLQEALTRYAQQEQIHKLPASPQNKQVDWGEAVDVSQFCGRQAQLATLEQWVIQDCCRLVAIVGMGGIGKTMLVTQLTQQLADTGQFEIVVWRSLRQAPPLIDFLRDLISALAPDQSLPIRLDATMRQLLEQLRHHRCLLILDNIEAVLSSGELVGTYRPGYEDYSWLFQQLGEGRHQSSILLTSREIPVEVAIPSGPIAPIRVLRLEGLSIEEGETILATKGLIQAEQPQVQELIERYRGNPLALNIAATPLKNLFNSNITAFLAQEALLFQDIRELLAQQFNRLSSLEQQVMYWLAINQEAVTASQLEADIFPSVSQVELRDALVSLDRRSLIEKINPTSAKPITWKLDCVSYTQQPVVMEYVIEQLIAQVCFEIEQAQIVYLRSHALVKAQAKDYVRDVQIRLIVQPILAKLLEVQGGSENLKNLLMQLLKMQQLQAPLQPGYFAGNVIHLMRQLGADLSHLDFSNLTIWQADLQMVNLHGTNFSHTDLSHSIFSQAISDMCVAYSPDAKHIATSHDSGEVCVWRVEDGQQTATFKEIVSWINSLVFSPDGETLIISNADQIVKLLHIPSGRVRGELHGHTSGVLSVALSADDRLLASSGEAGIVKVWDMQTVKCLKTLEGHQGWLSALAFAPSPQTPDKSYLLVSGGSDSTIRLWDVQSGQTLHIFEGHTIGVLAVAFSPDGRQIASSSVDHTICLWDVHTGQAIAAWQGHNNTAAWTLAFSPIPPPPVVRGGAGGILASGGEDKTIKLWNIETGQCHRTLLEHTAMVQSLAFSSDGLSLVSAALNQTIRLWNFQTGQCLKTLQGYSKMVFGVVFHPDGRMFASSHSDNVLRLWNVQTGECLSCLQEHSDRISSVVFSPDGRLLASGSYDHIRLWDVQTGNFLRAFRTYSWVNSVAFSSNGSLLASSGIARVVGLWDVRTGRCLRVIEPEVNWVPSVAFSPRSQCLASGNEDGTVKLWDVSNSQCFLTLEGHTRQSQAIAFAPAPRLASGSDDCTVKLWNLQTGQYLPTLQGHTRPVISISFHPQGKLLISDGFDSSLKLWDLQQGRYITTLRGHTSPIRSVAFDPEERWIVSSSEDGTIRLWDSYTGKCLRVLTFERPYEGMNILGVTRLTDAQKETLRVLGAIES